MREPARGPMGLRVTTVSALVLHDCTSTVDEASVRAAGKRETLAPAQMRTDQGSTTPRNRTVLSSPVTCQGVVKAMTTSPNAAVRWDCNMTSDSSV